MLNSMDITPEHHTGQICSPHCAFTVTAICYGEHSEPSYAYNSSG